MSDETSKQNDLNQLEDDVMRPEYDFSQGVRGKHYRAYREGHTVKIHQADGTDITPANYVP